MAAATAVLVTAGCSTQLVAVRVKNPDTIPPAGAPYNLTFTQWDITVTRRLVCEDEPGNDGKSKPTLDLKYSFEATPKEVRDPQREYVIDFLALRAIMKTTSITIDYHPNGALKSVNATADDKAADVVTGVAQAAAKLAASPAPKEDATDGEATARPDGDAPKVAPPQCEKGKGVVGKVKGLEERLASATDRLQLATAEVQRLTEMATAMGRAWSDKERKELSKQIGEAHRLRGDLVSLQKQLKEALASITYTDGVTWPAKATDSADKNSGVQLLAALTPQQLKSWEVGAPGKNSPAWAAKVHANNTPVWVRLLAASSIGKVDSCVGGECRDDSVQGLKYRMPAPGTLSFCRSEGCDPKQPADVLHSREGLVSQLGPVLTLPLKNYPFMKQTISATFDDAGRPLTLGYTEEAAAVNAVNALGALSDQLAKAREAKKPKSELEKIKEQTELLKAKTDLAAAKKSAEPAKYAQQAEATDAFKAETTLLQAELANLEAKAALDAALARAGQRP